LDQAPLYNTLNMGSPMGAFDAVVCVNTPATCTKTASTPTGFGPPAPENLAAAQTKLKVLICPSDNGKPFFDDRVDFGGCSATVGNKSYRTSYGFSVVRIDSRQYSLSGGTSFLWPAEPVATRAMFGFHSNSSVRDVLDGTSCTAMVLETCFDSSPYGAY